MLNLTDSSRLLEIAFFQDGSSDWYEFQRESMFINDVDSVCEPYDFTYELPETELHRTTYGAIRRYVIRDLWIGARYIVVRDCLDNYSIYLVEEV